MKVQPVGDSLHVLRGMVNVCLLKVRDGYALIDSGFANSADKILAAIGSVGVAPHDVRHLVLTHGHPDHIGSAAALQRATGAQVYAHALDKPIIEAGTGFRRGKPIPGLANALLVNLLLRPSLKKPLEPTRVDHLVGDGDALPFTPDLTAIHTPGHCAGQISLLWRRAGGILFTADACINMRGLALAAAQEDTADPRRRRPKLARRDFPPAVLGQGPPVLTGAADAFRAKWADASDR